MAIPVRRARNRPRLPLLEYPGRIECAYCGYTLGVRYIEGTEPHRFLVTHGDMAEWILMSDQELHFCPSNAKQWVIETLPARIYEVDDQGLIDTYGGRL